MNRKIIAVTTAISLALGLGAFSASQLQPAKPVAPSQVDSAWRLCLVSFGYNVYNPRTGTWIFVPPVYRICQIV
jgi:hypothetical protein